jgi:hypothetical protein
VPLQAFFDESKPVLGSGPPPAAEELRIRACTHVISLDKSFYPWYPDGQADQIPMKKNEIGGNDTIIEQNYSALEVSSCPLFKAREDQELPSNPKHQKRVNWDQGIHPAFCSTPAFRKQIRAGAYALLVFTLNAIYEKYGSGGISVVLQRRATYFAA